MIVVQFSTIFSPFITSDQLYPILPEHLNQLINVRDKFLQNFAQSNQYGQLTQSYIQRTFTLFNFLLSANVEEQVPIISVSVSNTQNELIETQLNLHYLFLCQSMQETIATNDFSYYEIELFKFFTRNHNSVPKLLPSIKDLYYIVDHKRRFYPFGVTRAYEILSLLIKKIDAFENSDLKRLSIGNLMEIMDMIDVEGVDDVENSMWKFIMAHLKHCQLDPSHITKDQIKAIITHVRNSTKSFKSAVIRQSVTEMNSLIIQYIKNDNDLEIIIYFAELLLSLLRDDDVGVRNRASEIAMDLIDNCEHKRGIHAEWFLIGSFILNIVMILCYSYSIGGRGSFIGMD